MSEPLLAHRPASQSSNETGEERGIEEEDALLTGQRTGKHSEGPTTIAKPHTRSKWREIGLFVWAMLATAAVVVLAVVYQHSRSEAGSHHGKRNLIFMVSDGMGPTSLALTRSWKHFVDGTPYENTLVLDDHLIGQSRTRSSSSLITDSAAGATAFSCGFKSYNGAISVLPDFEPCGSVMEAAKRKGYTTGLVVTTLITDATPAVFVSHARSREMEDAIALQMTGETHPLGRMVDLMVGGGRCHFLPNGTEGSCRNDDVDVIELAKEDGWRYIDSKSVFDKLDTKATELPLMALFASSEMPYEVDRVHQVDTYPSLEQQTKTALEILASATKGKDHGFFVMIEGSRIDHAGHANDPGAQVHEVEAYDRAMKAVLDFIDSHDKATGEKTLMVSTSDHETGGLATAKQLTSEYPEYVWFPGVLANVSHSASFAAHEYHAHMHAHRFDHNVDEAIADPETRKYLTLLAGDYLGIHDCDDGEIDSLIEKPGIAAYTFADMVSRRAQTGWTTHGHSGADVNIYASDPVAAKQLVGNHENTDVGAFLRAYLDVEDEVEDITRELQDYMHEHQTREELQEWIGLVPEERERLDGQDHLERYSGIHKFKKHKHRCEVCGV